MPRSPRPSPPGSAARFSASRLSCPTTAAASSPTPSTTSTTGAARPWARPSSPASSEASRRRSSGSAGTSSTAGPVASRATSCGRSTSPSCPTRADLVAILGLLDHGSRACLALRELRSRSAITLLRAPLDAIERFGRPRILRTDNEPIFTSRLFRFALRCLGIRHQRTASFAPWQNGRIERFFATFKERILPWLEQNGIPDDLPPNLALFRAWYNHARPHQHLDGLTPALAWARKQPAGRPLYVSEWDGRLTGLLWP